VKLEITPSNLPKYSGMSHYFKARRVIPEAGRLVPNWCPTAYHSLAQAVIGYQPFSESS
jgi:hypothetical protein